MEKVVHVHKDPAKPVASVPVLNQNLNSPSPMRPLTPKKDEKMKEKVVLVVIALVVMVAGVGTGKILAGNPASTTSDTGMAPKVETKNNTEAGVSDESVFKDSEEGVLEKGGIEGEGTHHLVRPGGPSKYIYMSSTVLDLESFVGKKVRVWGQTISGKKAGWLMDVGKVKVIE